MRYSTPIASLSLVLSAVALSLSAVSACSAEAKPAPAPIAVTCQEDMDCWDCHSMGNRVCGPANDAEVATAWDVWDYSNGAHSLKVDTSRTFRVDYVGSSRDYPRNVAENEVVLVGKDFNWYVFRASY